MRSSRVNTNQSGTPCTRDASSRGRFVKRRVVPRTPCSWDATSDSLCFWDISSGTLYHVIVMKRVKQAKEWNLNKERKGGKVEG